MFFEPVLFIDFLGSNQTALFLIVSFLGLAVGSFLNVVIYRLPIMLDRAWREQCCELLSIQDEKTTETFNLISPPSTCPHCRYRIRVFENIPVISFLYLKGRCSNCHQSISRRYILIECISAIFAMIVAARFGVSWQLFFALILTWGLLGLSMIDFDRYLLPDDIIFPLLWLGIGCNFFNIFTDLHSSLIGCMAGYLIFWSVYWLFKLFTGKEGMGYGDFKLLAMLGAWLGWKMLLPIVFISSIIGTIVGIVLIYFWRHQRSQPIPFGPSIAVAGWVTLLWGESLISAYLTLV